MPSFSRSIWNPRFSGAGDLELDLEAGDPLLPWPSARRHSRWIPEPICFEGIPPIIKSNHGNIFWADEQCTRRVGLTSTEARLFLRLLQVDEPEAWNYADYKVMFDNFGREQLRLEQLTRELSWWKIGSHRQKKIWEARIEWLARMSEPRPWLLFLMARRRRILKQATGRVLEGLRKKSEARAMAGLRMQSVGSEQPTSGGEKGSVDPLIINETTKPSKALVEVQQLKILQEFEPPLETHASKHAADTLASTASKLKSAASRIQVGLKAGYLGGYKHQEHSPPFPGPTRKPWEATRQDIRHQVEKLMPKPTPYIVIGWFRRSANDPTERTIQFARPEQLFHVLRNGERDLRGWRGYFSLKALQGFGLYKVTTVHSPRAITNRQ